MIMENKKRELLEVLVEKHLNGERLDMLDKNTLWFLINEYKKTNEYVDGSNYFSKTVDLILAKELQSEKIKENKKKCAECGKIFNSIGLGDDVCFTCTYVSAMIEREYE